MPKIPTYTARLLPESKTPTTGLKSAPLDLLTPVPRALGKLGEAVGEIALLTRKRAEEIKDEKDTAYVIGVSSEVSSELMKWTNDEKLANQGKNAFDGLAKINKKTQEIIDREKNKDEFKRLDSNKQNQIVARINSVSIQNQRLIVEHIKTETKKYYRDTIAISLDAATNEAASGLLPQALLKHNANLDTIRNKGIISEEELVMHVIDGRNQLTSKYIESLAATNPMSAYKKFQELKDTLSADVAMRIERTLKPRADVHEVNEFVEGLFAKNPDDTLLNYSKEAKRAFKDDPAQREQALKAVEIHHRLVENDKKETVEKLGNKIINIMREEKLTMQQLSNNPDMLKLYELDAVAAQRLYDYYEGKARVSLALSKEAKQERDMKQAMNYAFYLNNPDELEKADLNALFTGEEIGEKQYITLNKAKQERKKTGENLFIVIEMSKAIDMLEPYKGTLGDAYPAVLEDIERFIVRKGKTLLENDVRDYTRNLVNEKNLLTVKEFIGRRTMEENIRKEIQEGGVPLPAQEAPRLIDTLLPHLQGRQLPAQEAQPAPAPAPKAQPAPDFKRWLEEAKKRNPKISEDELIKYYNKEYGGGN